MRKCMCVVLLLMLCFSVAVAEEFPYMRQVPQNRYVGTFLLTPESYPQVCISPYPDTTVYGYNYNEPIFICFDLPANTAVESFDVESCRLIDMDHLIQYHYRACDYAYETFLNECDSDEYIIYDGSRKKAAYIEPERGCAYGLIGIPEIEKGTKLYISVYAGDLGYSDSTEKKTKVLSELIVAEIERVQNELMVVEFENHWSEEMYTGMKMLSAEKSEEMLVLDFPELTAPDSANEQKVARVFPISFASDGMEVCFLFDEETVLRAEFKLEMYTYVDYQKEDRPDEVHSVTLKDGNVFDVYAFGLKEYGSSTSVYSCLLRATDAGYSKDHNYYLNINLDGYNYSWTTVDEVARDLTLIMENITFVNPEDDPCVSAAVTAKPTQASGAKIIWKAEGTVETTALPEEAWQCVECEMGNNGNFCTNCGAPKTAADSSWKCPECQTANEGNFCSNCGQKKPGKK